MDLRAFTEPQQGATFAQLLAVAQRAERDPRVGHGGPRLAPDVQVMVGPEETAVAELLGPLRDGQQLGKRGALLRLGEGP